MAILLRFELYLSKQNYCHKTWKVNRNSWFDFFKTFFQQKSSLLLSFVEHRTNSENPRIEFWAVKGCSSVSHSVQCFWMVYSTVCFHNRLAQIALNVYNPHVFQVREYQTWLHSKKQLNNEQGKETLFDKTFCKMLVALVTIQKLS